MKNIIIFLILSSLALAQSWNTQVPTTINVNYLQNMDILTNKDGNHVLVNNWNSSTGVKTLNYNLINTSGSVVRSYLIESITNGAIEFPKISGDDNNLFVVYRLGGSIKIWKSIDVGIHFIPQSQIQVGYNTCMGIDLAYNSWGLHIVWSNRDKGNEYATYYQRFDNYNGLVDFKEVTDFTDGKGGRPSIALSDTKIHVSFDMGHGDLGSNFGLAYTRDKYYSNNNWEPEQQATTFQIMATKTSIRNDKLFLFYYLSVSDMGQFHSDMYVKTRDINGTTWTSPILIKSWCDVTELVKVKQTNNGDLNLIYKSGSALYWKTYNGSVWSAETLVSGYPSKGSLSFVYNDLYLVSNSGYSDGNIYYRQYSSNPSTPQNLALANNGGHPHLTWTKNIDPDVSSYKVYRNYGGWTCLGTTSNLYYDDPTILIYTGQMSSTEVDYKITGVDLGGLESQSYSNMVSCNTPGGNPAKQGHKEEDVILDYKLLQNYPNPFNPSTEIYYQLPNDGNVKLVVYNLMGEEVKTLVNGFQEKGMHNITFNAGKLASGMYIYKIEAGSFVQVKKMLLTK